MPKIFISYRREDSNSITGRIYDRLSKRFGKHNVFKDVDSIPMGLDFRKVLGHAVEQCDVLIAVIGGRWVDTVDLNGQRRLESESDFVRVEIGAALESGIPVIPVLVDGASMPRPDVLPREIQDLSFRNGTLVRHDPDFHRDMDRLIQAIKHPPSARAAPAKKPRILREVASVVWWGILPILFALIAIAWQVGTVLWHGGEVTFVKRNQAEPAPPADRSATPADDKPSRPADRSATPADDKPSQSGASSFGGFVPVPSNDPQ